MSDLSIISIKYFIQQGKEISVNVEIKTTKIIQFIIFRYIYIYTHKYKINFEEII